MKYCNHCGKAIADEAVFCPNCGCEVPNTNRARSDGYSLMSILGFVFAFISALAGLIISLAAYSEAKKNDSASSELLSKAGIIVSAVILGIGLFAGIIIVSVLLAGMGSYAGYIFSGGMI